MQTPPSPVQINDVTLRDGHQSLWATRMRIKDILHVAPHINKAGFAAAEVWGGATFDVAIRYKGEDPWKNLRQIKEAIPDTPLMMLLRGQSLVGYRNYPDDVVEAFVTKAAENGMNIFRVFDALNDTRNLHMAVRTIKKLQEEKHGVHAQGTICYTISPVHTIDGFIQVGSELKEMGCDSLCIKDMAGLLDPDAAFELVQKLKQEVSLPVTLHMHATMGTSDAALMAAVKAGVDVIDTANAGLSGRSGQSATQRVMDMMRNSDDPYIKSRLPDVDEKELAAAEEKLLPMHAAYGRLEPAHDPKMQQKLWEAQVPGGMISNFADQIRKQIAGRGVGYEQVIDRVLKEISAVRKDLGWPGLVTPASQIVGSQAVLNVLDQLSEKERYNSISGDTQALLLGKLGKTPAAPDEALVSKVERKTGEKRITHRPADSLLPALEETRKHLTEIGLDAESMEDVLTAALWGGVGVTFLQNRDNPQQIKDYEQPPRSPYFRAGGDKVVRIRASGNRGAQENFEKHIPFKSLGDVIDAVGPAEFEKIILQALEVVMIQDGSCKYLKDSEKERRLEQNRRFISDHLETVPKHLHAAGFTNLQLESGLGMFNQELRRRLETLGISGNAVPQIPEAVVKSAIYYSSSSLKNFSGQASNFDVERAYSPT